jgi:hypothetical protein
MRTFFDPTIPCGTNQEFDTQGAFHDEPLEYIRLTVTHTDKERFRHSFPRDA